MWRSEQLLYYSTCKRQKLDSDTHFQYQIEELRKRYKNEEETKKKIKNFAFYCLRRKSEDQELEDLTIEDGVERNFGMNTVKIFRDKSVPETCLQQTGRHTRRSTSPLLNENMWPECGCLPSSNFKTEIVHEVCNKKNKFPLSQGETDTCAFLGPAHLILKLKEEDSFKSKIMNQIDYNVFYRDYIFARVMASWTESKPVCFKDSVIFKNEWLFPDCSFFAFSEQIWPNQYSPPKKIQIHTDHEITITTNEIMTFGHENFITANQTLQKLVFNENTKGGFLWYKWSEENEEKKMKDTGHITSFYKDNESLFHLDTNDDKETITWNQFNRIDNLLKSISTRYGVNNQFCIDFVTIIT